LAGRRIASINRDGIAALLVGVGAVALLRTTLLPGVAVWDTGEAQVAPTVLGTMHSPGFPAYVVLGWLTTVILRPLGSPAFLMNLLSALLVGVAAGATVLVIRRLRVPTAIAVAAAAGFATTPVTWEIGVAADVHALHVALVVLVVLGLLRWETLARRCRSHPEDAALRLRADRALVLTAAAFGLAVANHGLWLLLVPAIGLYVLAVDARVLLRPRTVAAALGACLGVAALLYLELPLRAGPFRAPLVYGHPETWSGFWDIVLARQFQGSISGPLSDLGTKAHALLVLADQQLGPLVFAAPLALVVTAVRHPRYALLSGVATLVTCVFAASYANAAIERYYLGPVFFAWTWLAVAAGAAVDVLFARRSGAAGARTDRPAWLRPGLRAMAAVAVAAVLLVPTAAVFGARRHMVDRSGETFASAWLDAMTTNLAPHAVVVSWWSFSTPLWYAQLVEGRRPDIWIVDDRTLLDLGWTDIRQVIDATLGLRPVYLLRLRDSEVTALTDTYLIERVGRPDNLYRLTGRREHVQ
jgi:hypothetical protein